MLRLLNMNLFFTSLALAIVAAIPSAITENHVVRQTKSKGNTVAPNIVFILADDMGYGSLGSVTPFMNYMKENGVNIPTYYSQELCTPARAALLTGRYPLSIGMQFGSVSESSDFALHLDETTIAEVLKENGYTTYMFGKWHLGNASPRHLPTARGFDYYLGFLAGQSDYWSKHCPENDQFRDFMYSTSECYYMYDGNDLNHYSTFLYRDKAVEAIEKHDFEDSPMFMYLAVQAVHDPWTDLGGRFSTGIPEDYFSNIEGYEEMYSYITNSYPGANVRQYFMALSILDSSIKSIHEAIDSKGALDKTYFIFASDNGGCPVAGGRNYPLRGGKSTLFEGGTRVEAFVYSTLLDEAVRGTAHTGLFHVTDWFPTILEMAGISYESELPLDGFGQLSSLLSGEPSPRDYVLYNFYTNIEGKMSDFFNNAGGAIRDSKYKLLHTYTNDNEDWFTNDTKFDDDSIIYEKATEFHPSYDYFCTSPTATTFEFFLFDLENDPYETTNLYDSSTEMQKIQDSLYKQMKVYLSKATRKQDETLLPTKKESFTTWVENSRYITPWVKEDDLQLGHAAHGEEVEVDVNGLKLRKYPSNCGMYSDNFDTVVEENPTKKPTGSPTLKQSSLPTIGDSPTYLPTLKQSSFPSALPTLKQSAYPSSSPSLKQSPAPTDAPSDAEADRDVVASISPKSPTYRPTRVPTTNVDSTPTLRPTRVPTNKGDTHSPTLRPTKVPTSAPNAVDASEEALMSSSGRSSEEPSTDSTATATGSANAAGSKKATDVSSVVDRWDWSINDILVLSTLIIFFAVVVTCSVMWFTQPGKKESSTRESRGSAPSRGSRIAEIAGGGPGRMMFEETKTEIDRPKKSASKRPSSGSANGGGGHGGNPGGGAGAQKKRNSYELEPLEEGSFDQSLPSEAQYLLSEHHTDVPAQIAPSDSALVQTLLTVLGQGMTVNVHSVNGVKKARMVLEKGCMLHWQSMKVFAKKNKQLDLHDVLYVNWGKQTRIFHLTTSGSAPEDNCFSLVSPKGSLDIEVSSKVERDALAQGFTVLISRFKGDRSTEQVSWSN